MTNGPATVTRSELVDEPRIIERAGQGDVRAFEILYGAYVGRVHALCLRLSGDAGRAEDLTQDVFVHLWQKIGSFRGESAFFSWLYRLTINLVTDRMRSQLRKSLRETTSEEMDVHPHRRTTAPETGIALESAIAALPDGARTVFVLHDIEGYRHHEIAEMIGLAPGTSKAQLHRARKLLREMLS